MNYKRLSIIGLAALAATAIACGSGSPKGPTQGPGVDPKTNSSTAGTAGRSIVFEVTGTGKANNISYGVGGNMSQANGENLPWKKTATSTDSLLLVSLSAQSSGGSASTKIGCKVTVDGKVIVENASTGQYAVVTCSGTAN